VALLCAILPRQDTMIKLLSVTVLLLGASTALAARYGVVFSLDEARPNARITPGALNPAVNQGNIRQTICARGYSDMRLRDYEEDHLISIGLGGSPTAPQNLWPEPRHVVGGWGSYAKDDLEDKLHRLVCGGRLPLAQAQDAIASDWIAAYKRYVGPNPSPGRRHRRVE
jgi:hypothetical protein